MALWDVLQKHGSSPFSFASSTEIHSGLGAKPRAPQGSEGHRGYGTHTAGHTLNRMQTPGLPNKGVGTIETSPQGKRLRVWEPHTPGSTPCPQYTIEQGLCPPNPVSHLKDLQASALRHKQSYAGVNWETLKPHCSNSIQLFS